MDKACIVDVDRGKICRIKRLLRQIGRIFIYKGIHGRMKRLWKYFGLLFNPRYCALTGRTYGAYMATDHGPWVC